MADVTMPAAKVRPYQRITRASGAALTWPFRYGSNSNKTALLQITQIEFGVVPSVPNSDNSLLKPTWQIEGHVYQRDADTGDDNPVAGCEVCLFVRDNKRIIRRAFSDATGYYGFFGLPPNTQYFAVAFDVDGLPLQNALILDKLASVAP